MYESTFFALPPRWMLALTIVVPLGAWLAVRAWRPSPLALARTAITLSVATAVILYFFDRQLYEQLLYENGPIELWTALVLLVAGGMMLRAARDADSDPPPRLLMTALGVAFSLGAAEELSWGQNLLQWESPDVFRRWNEQQETNLHNITGRVLNTRGLTILILLAFGVVGPRLARRTWRPTSTMAAAMALAPAPSFTPLFIVASVLCLDLPTGLEAELGELLGAMLFAITLSERHGVARRRAAIESAPAPSRGIPHHTLPVVQPDAKRAVEMAGESPTT